MSVLIAAMWLTVAPIVTVINLDNPPDWLTVNEYGNVQFREDGGWFNAGFGCDSFGIIYYRRTLSMHQADVRRDYPGLSEIVVRKFAFKRFIETEAHELAHGVDCADDGLLNGSPGHEDWITADAYCMSSDVERYACAVVETGRIR